MNQLFAAFLRIRGFPPDTMLRVSSHLCPSSGARGNERIIMGNLAVAGELTDIRKISASEAGSEGAEPDTMPGEAQPDTMPGEAQPDTMPGEAQPDTMPGEAQPDTMPGEIKPETMPGEL
jgi:hypothetical protein